MATLLSMSLGIQRVLRVVKCSNATTGLDFFFFTSLFHLKIYVSSFQVRKVRHVVVPWEWHQISGFREICFLFYIALLRAKTVQNPYPLRVALLIENNRSSLLARKVNHLPRALGLLVNP